MATKITKDFIISWLHEHFPIMKDKPTNINPTYYVINPDLTVDILGGGIYFPQSFKGLTAEKELPIKFGKVNGNFLLCNSELSSFKNFPSFVLENLECSNNKIKNFLDCPSYIGGSLNLTINEITSLKGFPTVSRDILLGHNQISSLQGLPNKIHAGLMLHNNQLSNLDLLPEQIKGNLQLSDNKIESIENKPAIIEGDFCMDNNPLKKLFNCEFQIGGKIYIDHEDDNLLPVLPQRIDMSFLEFQKIKQKILLKKQLEQDVINQKKPKNLRKI